MSRTWKIRGSTSMVRAADSSDWKDIYRIAGESDQFPRHAYDAEPFSKRCPSAIHIPCFAVICDSRGIHGYVVWSVRNPGNRAELISIAVEPKRRRVGHGTRLLWFVVRKLAANGCRRLLATVDEYDDVSIEFLRSAGMRSIGIRRQWYGDHDGYRFEIETGAPK